MAPNPRHPATRLVQLSATARADLANVHDSTADFFGDQQADDYTAFLLDTAQMLADAPGMAPRVPNDKTARIFVARWKSARRGHRIVFDETPSGILVLRILSTSQDWPKKLRAE